MSCYGSSSVAGCIIVQARSFNQTQPDWHFDMTAAVNIDLIGFGYWCLACNGRQLVSSQAGNLSKELFWAVSRPGPQISTSRALTWIQCRLSVENLHPKGLTSYAAVNIHALRFIFTKLHKSYFYSIRATSVIWVTLVTDKTQKAQVIHETMINYNFGYPLVSMGIHCKVGTIIISTNKGEFNVLSFMMLLWAPLLDFPEYSINICICICICIWNPAF